MKKFSSIEQEKIFQLFLKNEKLKFSEIEKNLKIRSNMVSYHLDQMKKQNLIEKKGLYYFLTKKAEKHLPAMSQDSHPLSIILVNVVRNNKILLMKRNNRPYKNYFGFVGGKMLLHESIQDATKRLLFEKTKLDSSFKKINAVLHERVDSDVKHSFILFLVTVSVKNSAFKESSYGSLKWFDLKKLDSNEIIPSDYWLIKNRLKSEIKIDFAIMNDLQGSLKDFKLL